MCFLCPDRKYGFMSHETAFSIGKAISCDIKPHFRPEKPFHEAFARPAQTSKQTLRDSRGPRKRQGKCRGTRAARANVKANAAELAQAAQTPKQTPRDSRGPRKHQFMRHKTAFPTGKVISCRMTGLRALSPPTFSDENDFKRRRRRGHEARSALRDDQCAARL